MKKSNKGFTLIELIIVIAILGIIAAIAIPKLTEIRYRSQVNSDIRSAEEIARMVRVWETDNALNPASVVPAYPEINEFSNTDKFPGLGKYISTDLRADSYDGSKDSGTYYVALSADGKIWVAIGKTGTVPTIAEDPAEGSTLSGNYLTTTRKVNYVGKVDVSGVATPTAGWAAVVE